MRVNGLIIGWEYDEGRIQLSPGSEDFDTVITVCSAYTDNGKEDEPPIHQAQAMLGKGDVYDKETGRKLALLRLLQKLYPTPTRRFTEEGKPIKYTSAAESVYETMKANRFAVWEAYRTLSKKPRWPINSKSGHVSVIALAEEKKKD